MDVERPLKTPVREAIINCIRCHSELLTDSTIAWEYFWPDKKELNKEKRTFLETIVAE